MNNKRGFEIEQIGWVLLFVLILVLVFAALFLFTSKGASLIEFIKNIT